MAFNVLAGLLLSATPGAAAPFARAETDGARVLCTAADLVETRGPSGSGDAAHRSGDGGICIFCLPMMSAGAGLPLVAPQPRPPRILVLQPRPVPRGLVWAGSGIVRTVSARAPPAA